MTSPSGISWKGAFGIATLAVYGPFLVMGTYVLLFVSCSHCKTAVWTLLPLAPGILPTEVGLRLLHVPRPSDLLGFACAALMSLALVSGLALLARRGRESRTASIIVAVALSSALAYGMLSVIRA